MFAEAHREVLVKTATNREETWSMQFRRSGEEGHFSNLDKCMATATTPAEHRTEATTLRKRRGRNFIDVGFVTPNY